MRRVILGAFGLLTMAFLVLPILAVVPLSFSDSALLLYPVEHFSTRWYGQVLASSAWREALENSLFVTPASTLVAVLFGTLAALALHDARFRARSVLITLFVLPIVVPPVMLGLGVYVFYTPWHLSHSLWTMMLVHATLGAPFVVLSVLAALSRMDPRLADASDTLGASAWFTFSRVTWPAILPGVAAGAVIAMALSIDEVIASDFLSAPQTMTVSLQILQATTQNLSPDVAAVATLLIAVSVTAAGGWIACLLVGRRRAG